MTVEAGIGAIEQVHKQHVCVSVPVRNASEGDLRADDCLTSETRNVVDLPGVRAMVIQIEFLGATGVVCFVSVVS